MALNNPQELICHQAQPDQTNVFSYRYSFINPFGQRAA